MGSSMLRPREVKRVERPRTTWTWENPVYSARYEEGLRLTGRHGVFPVREGGTLLYWARHFTLDELSGLIAQAGGDVAEVVEGPSPTRSGNLIRGVALLANPQV